MNAKEKIVYTGFIAQEVEKVAEKMGFDFSGVYKPQSEHDTYGLSYADFVVPLLKSVQELSKKNTELEKANAEFKTKIANQQEQIDAILEQLNSIGKAQGTDVKQAKINQNETIGEVDAPSIEQNALNPFNGTTIIKYHLPSSGRVAQMTITDTKSILIKQFRLNGKDDGKVTLSENTLSSGTYFYSLLADGKKVVTKQMQIIK